MASKKLIPKLAGITTHRVAIAPQYLPYATGLTRLALRNANATRGRCPARKSGSALAACIAAQNGSTATNARRDRHRREQNGTTRRCGTSIGRARLSCRYQYPSRFRLMHAKEPRGGSRFAVRRHSISGQDFPAGYEIWLDWPQLTPVRSAKDDEFLSPRVRACPNRWRRTMSGDFCADLFTRLSTGKSNCAAKTYPTRRRQQPGQRTASPVEGISERLGSLKLQKSRPAGDLRSPKDPATFQLPGRPRRWWQF